MPHTLSYLKNYKANLIFGPFFKLLEAIFELLVPLIMADLIDNGINKEGATLRFILGRGGALVALGIIGLGCSLICQYVASKCSQGFGTDLRNGLFAKINKLSFAQLDSFGSSSLITRMTGDINQLQIAVAMLIRLVIRAPFLAIGSAVMAIILNPLLGTIFVVAAPLLAICIFLIMIKTVPIYKNIQKNIDETTRITQENLAGVRVIRAFSNQEEQIKKFEQKNMEMTSNNVKVGKVASLLSPLTFVIINLAIAAVLYFGGKIVHTGSMTQGEIIAFINYLTQISIALVVVAQMVILYTKSFTCAKRVEEILATETTLKSAAEIESFDGDCAITFNNVNFAYATKEVITNLSFSVTSGQTIGIIGGTGCGKSTIANLIAGFYQPQSGNIFIGGIDIQQYSETQLAKTVAFAMQNSTIFSGTIRSNMLLANKDATDEQIMTALNIAQAEEFVLSKIGGLDYEISQNGKNLSGGQKQRLAVARAILVNPKILILDDSTSALDYITEANLLKALSSKLDKKITKIIISQRVNSLKKCNTIMVVDNGKLCGKGNHKELIASCDVYKEICKSQQKEGQK